MSIKKNTVAIYLTYITQKIDGTFDYQKLRETRRRQSAARKRNIPGYSDKINEYSRTYYHKNKEKLNQRRKELLDKKPPEYRDKIREYQRKYRQERRSKNHSDYENHNKANKPQDSAEYYQSNRDKILSTK